MISARPFGIAPRKDVRPFGIAPRKNARPFGIAPRKDARPPLHRPSGGEGRGEGARPKRSLLPLVVSSVVFALLLSPLSPLLPQPARAAPILCDPAPPLALRTLDGTKVTLPTGQAAIVDFFATWCGPCHQALADLSQLVAAQPVPLYIVAVGEPRDTVAAFFARRPPPPGAVVVLDPDASAARRFGQTRFPTTFLIDGAGRIRHINRGYGPGYLGRRRRWLAGMLAPGAPPCSPPTTPA